MRRLGLGIALAALALGCTAHAQSYRPGFASGFRPGFQFLAAASQTATTVWSAAASSTTWTVNGLTATKNASAVGAVKASKALTAGRGYFEIQSPTAAVTIRAGTATTASDPTVAPGTGVLYYQSNSGAVVRDGTTVGTFATYAANDVIGFDVDRTASTVAIYKNGTLITTVTGIGAGDLVPYAYNGAANTVVQLNAGQSAFTGSLPSGSTPWG